MLFIDRFSIIPCSFYTLNQIIKMKKILLLCALCASQVFAQNIDDNFINYNYIQIPLIPVDEDQRMFRFETKTNVDQANQDSAMVYQAKLANSISLYEQQLSKWYAKMSLLQQLENTSAVSQAANYPIKPSLELVRQPILNSLSLDAVAQTAEGLIIPGFQKGDGGLLVSFTLNPLRDIRINYKKTGVGLATRYTYSCTYYLSTNMSITGPDESVLLEQIVGNSKRTKSLGKYKSTYAFLDWYMKNSPLVYGQMETEGRRAAIESGSNVLESQFGFVNKNRKAEVYSVKKYKDYDYTDVTMAYNKTSEALLLVGKSPDRSEAYETLKEARDMWNVILEESNLQNKKERVNSKISAMIWCNVAEISVWMGDFSQVDLRVQNIKNSSIFKAKNHINGETGFYNDQKTRWQANFE